MADLFPFGVYDTKRCGLAYIGLHANEADVWQVFLGWPDKAEIADAQTRGLAVLPLTVHYKPPNASAPRAISNASAPRPELDFRASHAHNPKG